MSKKLLEKHVESLTKKQAANLVLELYEKFPAVKTYFNFVFNPKEDQLLAQARIKVSQEYFPVKKKRPKGRRSVAQKYIKHFNTLGVAPEYISEFMWFNLGLMHAFSEEKPQGLPFYKSLRNSFKQALQYVNTHKMLPLYKDEIIKIYHASKNWPNAMDFEYCMDMIDY